MARNITVVPARANRTSLAETIVMKKVAAYCRVSTDQAEQLSSYEAQVNYYTNYINDHAEYELVKIYADEGLSGTSTKKTNMGIFAISLMLPHSETLTISAAAQNLAWVTLGNIVGGSIFSAFPYWYK